MVTGPRDGGVEERRDGRRAVAIGRDRPESMAHAVVVGQVDIGGPGA